LIVNVSREADYVVNVMNNIKKELISYGERADYQKIAPALHLTWKTWASRLMCLLTGSKYACLMQRVTLIII
jgi:hypothetical protein